MQLTTTARRAALAVCLLDFAFTAQANVDDSYVSAMNYVSLDAQGDNADSKQFSGTGSVGLGKYLWLQGTMGKLTDNNTDGLGDLQNFGIGTGLKGEQLQFSLNFNSHKNDASYRQRDIVGALDWYAERISIGLDVSHRTTDNAMDTVRDFPTLNRYNVALHIDETLTGNGFGAHANFDITDALSLSLGGISYSYDSDYTLTSSTNPTLVNVLRNFLATHPTISETFYLNNSGITRSLALLDNSYNLGLSYSFDSASLATQYFRDKALDSDSVTNTVTLGAAIFLGDHWIVAPQIGQSQSDTAADVTFGGLSLSYNW